jgi:hypothetical protein
MGWPGPLRRQDDDHHFDSLLMLAVTEGLGLRFDARDSRTGYSRRDHPGNATLTLRISFEVT